MDTIGGKVWHIHRPENARPSDLAQWDKRALRRAAAGYVVTPDVHGHPVDTVCPYCKVIVVVVEKPGG